MCPKQATERWRNIVWPMVVGGGFLAPRPMQATESMMVIKTPVFRLNKPLCLFVSASFVVLSEN
jgi:hypothetical protein